MLRLALSASNHHPWRIAQDGNRYHFYLQRTPGYGPGSSAFIMLNIADLQRVDMRIAMCHLELTARELGLTGQWEVRNIGPTKLSSTPEYVVTWVGNAPG